jgi:hypothetical protein
VCARFCIARNSFAHMDPKLKGTSGKTDFETVQGKLSNLQLALAEHETSRMYDWMEKDVYWGQQAKTSIVVKKAENSNERVPPGASRFPEQAVQRQIPHHRPDVQSESHSRRRDAPADPADAERRASPPLPFPSSTRCSELAVARRALSGVRCRMARVECTSN